MQTDFEIHNSLDWTPVEPPAVQIRTLKRFEFSASRALSGGRLSGNNFIGWAGVRGVLDEQTGMLINISDLKAILKNALDDFDHRNLTRQLAPLEATTANTAQALFRRVSGMLEKPVELDTLELEEEDENAAFADEKGVYSIARAGFSAAHRTYAPNLSVEANEALYGRCALPGGHGHNYVVEAALPDVQGFPAWLIAELDHRNLSTDIPALQGSNVSTEAIARLIAQHTPSASWVRVWETPDFYAEYLPQTERYRLGRRYRFHAAHRLDSPALSAEQNQALYGKCNRPDPHGHTYIVLVSVESRLDPLTGTAFDLAELDRAAAAVLLERLDHTYLDEDIPFFRLHPSTGENIAAYLYAEFAQRLPAVLHEVRLWETPNNQFIAFRHS